MAIIRPTVNLVAHPGSTSYPKPITCTSSNGTVCRQLASNRLDGIDWTDNLPRHDFHPVTGEYLGMLFEKGNTNLLSPSRDISGDTSWVVNPSGNKSSETLNKFFDKTGSGTKIVSTGGTTLQRNFSGLTPNAYYTFSVYAKSVAASASITLTRNASYAKPVSISASNWTRLFITVQASSAGTATIALTFTTSTSYYLDAFQLELGDLSSYIDTGTTRSDTKCSLTDHTKINAEQGTIFIKYRVSDNEQYTGQYYSTLCSFGSVNSHSSFFTVQTKISAVANNKDYLIIRGYSSSTASELEDESAGYIPGNTALVKKEGPNQVHKVAIAYKESAPFRVSIDGQSVVTGIKSAPAATVAGYGRCVIGGIYDSTSTLLVYSRLNYCLDGHLQHFAYFPRALEDNDLISLTS